MKSGKYRLNQSPSWPNID